MAVREKMMMKIQIMVFNSISKYFSKYPINGFSSIVFFKEPVKDWN